MVYSGIAPPPQLLEAMAEARAGVRPPSIAKPDDAIAAKMKVEQPMDPDFGLNQIPQTPMEAAGPSGIPDMPPRPGAVTSEPPMYSDAPPSYEDAIATNLSPVEAARPEYAPAPAGEDDVLRRDEKRGWV